MSDRRIIALYPGSFDPITLGHLDIIERASKLFEHTIVAVLQNPKKAPLFTVEERIDLINRATGHLGDRVGALTFNGLTVACAHEVGASVLIRGLRVMSDFEFELQMAHTNKTLSEDVETVFLATRNEYSFLSSSLVKEIARFGGPVDRLVPEPVIAEIQQRCFPNPPLA